MPVWPLSEAGISVFSIHYHHEWSHSNTDFRSRRKCLSCYRSRITRKECPHSSCCQSRASMPSPGRYRNIPRTTESHYGRRGDPSELWRILHPLLHGPLSWARIHPGTTLQRSLGWGLWVTRKANKKENKYWTLIGHLTISLISVAPDNFLRIGSYHCSEQ